MSHRVLPALMLAAGALAALATAILPSCADPAAAPDGGLALPDVGVPDVSYFIPDATVVRPDVELFLEHDGGGAPSCNTTCDCPQGRGCVNGACRVLSNPVYCCAKPGCPAGAACLDNNERPGSCFAADASVDGGGSTDVGHGVGAGCTTIAECDPGLTCLPEDQTPFLWEGYCSVSPCTGTPCPQSSVCINFGQGGTSACMRECVSDGDCRPENFCFLIPNSSISICFPDCHDDFVDCRPWDGLTYCSRQSGRCEPTPMNNTNAQVGDACLDSTDCPAGGICLGEYFWGMPGGSCSKLCMGGPEATPCASDELCVAVDQAGTIGVCFPQCVGGACPNRANAVCSPGNFCLPM